MQAVAANSIDETRPVRADRQALSARRHNRGRRARARRLPAAALLVVAVFLACLLIPGLAAAQASGQPAGAAPGVSIKVKGWLSTVWADGQPGSAPMQPVHALFTDDGAVTYLSSGEDLARFDRQRVVVTGVLDAGVLDARSISVDASLAAGSPQALAGAQPWLSVLCKFADSPAEPNPLSYFQAMYNDSPPHLGDYWKQVSYDQANIAGSGAVGWYRLPQPRSAYITDRGLDLERAALDCTAAADPFVNFGQFVGLNLMFNEELDGGAWGGSWYMTLDGVRKLWYVTWEPPWGYQNIGVIAHEMGHGFGLRHSSGDYGEVLDNKWDVMSDLWCNCHLYTDRTYGCVPQGTIAFHKDKLGWLPGNRVYVAAERSATITLERLGEPASNGYLMARIPIDGSTSHYYTLEARRLDGYDVRTDGDAVILHEVWLTRTAQAHVIDVDNDGDTGSPGAMWTVGETFTDAARSIQFSVRSATATGYVVAINLGAASPSPTPTSTPSPTPAPPRDPFEPNDVPEQAAPIQLDAPYLAYIGVATDVDFFRVTVPVSGGQIRAALTYLPEDYDLYLLDGQKRVVASSLHGGVANEYVFYTPPQAGVYYLMVAGYGQAFDASRPYRLMAQLGP